MVINLLAALIVFGIIILVHEFGHFLLAKKNGVGVIEFSIGMGPRLLSFDKGGTKYSLKALPFGGSCMMLGEDEENRDERAFNNKPVWARISVIAAGPIFNFILAFVFALIIISVVGIDLPKLAGVMDGYPAQEAGMQAGDTISKINNQKIRIYRDVQMYLMLHPGETLDVEYERDGQKYDTVLVPKYNDEYKSYMMGITVSGYRTKTDNAAQTIGYAAYEVKYWISTAIKSIGMLLQGKVKSDEIAGPVGIVNMIGETVEESKAGGWIDIFLNLANMCVLLSANLGIMNLLPIPALDGGRLVFLFLEVVRGKPVDPEKEGMVHVVGMLFLMALMVVVLFNDIRNLF